MRIAIVTESFFPTVNGVSNSVARITVELEKLGHTVLIIAPGEGPLTWSNSKVFRVPSVPLPAYTMIPMGIPTQITYKILADFKPDIVHAAGPIVLGAWGLHAATRLRIPAIAVYQTDMPSYTRYYNMGVAQAIVWRWLQDIHSMAMFNLAPSSATAMDLRRNGIRHVKIWGRGVDLSVYSPSLRSQALRSSLGVKENGVLIGYVGRLASEKNVGLLRALKGLPNSHVVVVGDGPMRAKLTHQLGSMATFLGNQSGNDLAEIYASLDIFVHTGNLETFCQTIQEAQASGVVAVAPAQGGPLDLIDHKTSGFLYRPNDKTGLRNTVRWLIENPAARAQMAAAGRKRVTDRSWANVTVQLIDYYHQAIAKFNGLQT